MKKCQLKLLIVTFKGLEIKKSLQ
ncbi:hypothetical protein MTR67_047968 [Solanum verrucosum]|uniref:Uncharacterized protein n=1 Tax=Solanum verrucosum TaxID=315347 RepID=A0AAF0V0K5_SOLVR|nr:hypothetical protein MTR67_047968 [Solanum verrucosum]